MRTRSIILVIGSAIVLAGSGIHAPGFSQAAQTADEAADEGMVELPELLTSETFERLGFRSISEASDALVDKKSRLQSYTVDLKALRNFKRGDKADKLLDDEHTFIYPITVDGTVRSSMTVTQLQDGTWGVTGWGAPGFINQLTSLSFSDSNFLVWIPGLYIYFLGERQQDRKLMLASINNKPEFNLERRVWKQADEVFLQLSKHLPKVKPNKQRDPAQLSDPE